METPDPLLRPGVRTTAPHPGVSKSVSSATDRLVLLLQRFQRLWPERIGLSGLMFAPFAGQLMLAWP